MSYLLRAIRVQLLWYQLKKYKKEKNDALIGPGHISRTSLNQPLTKMQRFYLSMQTEGTLENSAWIGCKGFLGGIVFSWVVFLFCAFAFRMSLGKTTWLGSFLATCLSFALAFSSIVRCYMLMLLPQLFSKRGRQALTAYAFILAFGGPARNSVHNLGVLTGSLACGQEQLKRSMRQLVDLVKEPFHAMKTTIKDLIKDIEKTVQPLRDVITRVVRVFTSVISVIDGVFSWLGNIVVVCNKETGTPYQRCVRSLDDAIDDCKVKLGPLKFMCSIVSVVKGLCLTVKVVDALCAVMDVISNEIIGRAKRKLAAFRQHVADMVYVSIDIEHSVKVNTTASRSFEDVVSSIVNEVQGRTETLRNLQGLGIILPGFALLLLIFKVLIYRHKFLTSDRYDNRYITRKIAELDLTRVRMNLPTVLPLELRERRLYTTLTSLTLLGPEQRLVISSFFFLFITTSQIATYILCDYGIYFMLTLIRKQGLGTATAADFPNSGIDVEGNGALADLYKKIGKAFQPPSPSVSLDPVSCLPDPSPPDKAQLIQIGVLLLISWALAITEPYGLRLRSVVLSFYYPGRAQQRAVWLHNHIILARGSLAVFTRDLLRLQFSSASGPSAWQRILHRHTILQKIFGAAVKACTSCAIAENNEIKVHPCPGPGCSATYCEDCEYRIRNCLICYELMNRFNMEIEEASDSSDDDLYHVESRRNFEIEDSGEYGYESSYSDYGEYSESE